jgi:hypothetical protein
VNQHFRAYAICTTSADCHSPAAVKRAPRPYLHPSAGARVFYEASGLFAEACVTRAQRLAGLDSSKGSLWSCFYYGDEIAMQEAAIAPDQVRDPLEKTVPDLGRDGCRTPCNGTRASGT